VPPGRGTAARPCPGRSPGPGRPARLDIFARTTAPQTVGLPPAMSAQPPLAMAAALVPPIDVYLQPGEYFVGGAGYRLHTLLGSCVSITLWHPGRRVGAMSHFLLAARPRPSGTALDGRYGDEAVELMRRDLLRLRVPPQECEARLFGGGNMLPAGSFAYACDIGRRNGEAARRLLRRHGIEIRSEHLFGNGHRRIVFTVGTGDVWVRHTPYPAPEA